MALPWEVQHLQLQQKFRWRLIKKLQCLLRYSRQFDDDLVTTHIALLNIRTCGHINNPHKNIKFTIEEQSNGELAFLDTLLKRNNGEISVLI